jgi:glucose/arabinose dehydrogenase/cytochrome c2
MRVKPGFAKLLLVPVTVLLGASAIAADAGKDLFKTQCALCHSAEQDDGGGAQGPSLRGIKGRKSASTPNFSYTAALKASGLTWDHATLDRFLASPFTVVPGSAMLIPVANSTERESIIAYLESAAVNPAPVASGPAFPPPTPAPPGTPEYVADAPGKMHHVTVAELPKPYATKAASNFPRVAPAPALADRKLSLPPGFKIDVFAQGLQGPRKMLLAPNGDVFVAMTQAGKIQVLRPAADGAKPAESQVFVDALKQPNGMAFYPAVNPQWLYVAETNRVVRFPYKSGDLKVVGTAQVVVPQLSPTGGGHYTRDLVFSPDGKRFFVSVGSLGNIAEDLSKKSAGELRAWDKAHGMGSGWDKETNRAAVLVFDTAKPGAVRTYANGIRNCVGLGMSPTGDLWCTTNERDMLGDDLVPDYATRVREKGFYGWPWYYLGDNEDPRQAGQRPDLKGKVTVPDVLFTAHSAATSIAFYGANKGASAFPAEYQGNAFVSLHGSWNRGFRTGHKIVRLRLKNGVPVNEYEDFLTGFIVDNNSAWARPAAVVVAKDGSLLLADDGNNVVWRISYTK